MVIDKIKDPQHFKLNRNTKTIILGDSQAQFAFNPACIKNSVNGAVVAEPLFYTYYKLRFIHHHNKQLENIILSFSPHNLSEFNEEKLYTSEDLLHFYDQYFMLLDSNGIKRIQKMNLPYIVSSAKYSWGVPLEFYKYTHLWINIMHSKQTPQHYPFWGHYDSRDRSDIQMKRVRWIIGRHYYSGDQVAVESKIMLAYAEKMTRFCKQNHLQLWLVTPPLHKAYRQRIPPFFTHLLSTTVDHLVETHGIHYHDFSRMEIPELYFYDCDHLNAKGAELFSHKINQLLMP